MNDFKSPLLVALTALPVCCLIFACSGSDSLGQDRQSGPIEQSGESDDDTDMSGTETSADTSGNNGGSCESSAGQASPCIDPNAVDPDPATDPNPDPDPDMGGSEDAGSIEDPTLECEIIQCFRAIECVETCGGPVLASGCCPCAEGTFDSIECDAQPDAGAPPSGETPDLDDLNTPCTDGTCPAGLTPVEYYGIAGPQGPLFCSCSIPCGEDPAVCPEGTTCGTISDGPGVVCLVSE